MRWDAVTDILVMGYGLAGGVAAVAAHDAGAKVLLVEKAPHPGGLSVIGGIAFLCVKDVPGAINYFRHISGGRVPDDVIQAFAQGLSENEAHLRELAQADGAEIERFRIGEDENAVYPYPGADSFYIVRVKRIPGFDGFKDWFFWMRPGVPNKFKLVMDNVQARGIEVWLSSPARRLVQDGAGVVVGAVVEHEGRELRVAARRGVVLTTGGFEQNEWMKLQFLQGTPFYAIAPLTHTGDGILMAQKAGAALWHMWHVHGSYGFKYPEVAIAFRHPWGGQRNLRRHMPWIVVDRFGARYMNEAQPAVQDTNHRPMELFDPDLPGYPRIPSYLIFDEAGRKLGPIALPRGLNEPQYAYRWSKDNLREVEKGWILKAPSLEGLAQKMATSPEYGGPLDGSRLRATVAAWNDAVAQGKDLLGRPPGTMMALDTPPFYATPVWPIITNTQGGPVHNARQQVLDPFGQPVPRLYAAGELGSFFGHLYELGGNLGECLCSGRIAGVQAASESPWQ